MYPDKHEKEKSLDHFNDYYPIKKRDNVLYCCLMNDTSLFIFKENIMWTKPTATEMRFGFEVCMYVMNK